MVPSTDLSTHLWIDSNDNTCYYLDISNVARGGYSSDITEVIFAELQSATESFAANGGLSVYGFTPMAMMADGFLRSAVFNEPIENNPIVPEILCYATRPHATQGMVINNVYVTCKIEFTFLELEPVPGRLLLPAGKLNFRNDFDIDSTLQMGPGESLRFPMVKVTPISDMFKQTLSANVDPANYIHGTSPRVTIEGYGNYSHFNLFDHPVNTNDRFHGISTGWKSSYKPVNKSVSLEIFNVPQQYDDTFNIYYPDWEKARVRIESLLISSCGTTRGDWYLNQTAIMNSSQDQNWQAALRVKTYPSSATIGQGYMDPHKGPSKFTTGVGAASERSLSDEIENQFALRERQEKKANNTKLFDFKLFK